MATESTEFVADYTTCNSLRDQSTRLSRLNYGATSIADNGHPTSSGIVDQKVMCTFRPRPPRPGGGRDAAPPGRRL